MSTRTVVRGASMALAIVGFGGASCVLEARALAQHTTFNPNAAEPLPTDAPPPKGLPGGGYWMPGQPLPVTGQNNPNNPIDANGGLSGATKGPTLSGRGTGEAIVRPEDLASSGVSVDDPHPANGDIPTNIPATHTVRKGDTLWDVSQSYFRNPWYWPKLWAANPAITNPHWIYPGDVLRLRSQNDAGASVPLSAQGSQPNLPTRITHDNLVEAGIHLRQTGFVEPGELKTAGRIAASREERMLLSYLDEAYVEYEGDKKPKPGDRLTIYKVQREVKRPGTKEVLGHIVEIAGELEIRSIGDRNVARAVIVEAMMPIERDFRVGALRRRFDLVDTVPDSTNVDALVVSALRPSELMGEAMVVIVDRGRDDGLVTGNRLMFVRRGDGLLPRMQFRPQDDSRLPRELMGEVLIVEVRGHTSTGVVTRSSREMEIGDHLEARKGY